METLQALSASITTAGGIAETATIDAMDEKAVNRQLKQLVEKYGSIDISFNAIGTQVVQNMPLVEMTMADFVHPAHFMLKTQFITAIAAGKQMKHQGKGVILTLTRYTRRYRLPLYGRFWACLQRDRKL